MEKLNISIALEVLNEVSAEFPETSNLIEERLQQKFLKENISVKEVIYFSLANLKADIFYCVMLGFKARICFFHYEPMSYIC